MSEDDQSKVYLKTHRSGREVIVAVCDCELMGKRFEEGPLHVEVCDDFFGLDEACHAEVERALSNATMANFVGSRAVRCAVRCGYVDEENVLVIGGVPCAQMVRM